jgi:hypothetical protein
MTASVRRLEILPEAVLSTVAIRNIHPQASISGGKGKRHHRRADPMLNKRIEKFYDGFLLKPSSYFPAERLD